MQATQQPTTTKAPAKRLVEIDLKQSNAKLIVYESGAIGIDCGGWKGLSTFSAKCARALLADHAQVIAALAMPEVQAVMASKEEKRQAAFDQSLAAYMERGLSRDEAALLANAKLKQLGF